MITDKTQSVWYKRYVPHRVKDVILPEEIKTKIQDMVSSGNLTHLGLFSATPGTGKSSTARAIIEELGWESKWINASLDKGIDVLRGTIAKFASQTSFDNNPKIVVMDEFDSFTPDGQRGFRGFIDEFSETCVFIFTGNYKEKIIEPLLDRMEVYDFNTFPRAEMVKPIFERLNFILKTENIEYDPKDLVPVINTFYPSIRKMVGTLQRFSKNGTFVVNQHDLDNLESFDVIINAVKQKDFTKCVSLVNELSGPNNMYTYLYKNMSTLFDKSIQPSITVIVARYQHMSETVRDKHINLSACLTEIAGKL